MKRAKTFPRPKAAEVHAATYLTTARAFFSAAERLLNPNDAFDKPVNFLHAHAMERVLSVGVRKSETVALRDPVMPVTDGFSG
jgi:hypothetical protein